MSPPPTHTKNQLPARGRTSPIIREANLCYYIDMFLEICPVLFASHMSKTTDSCKLCDISFFCIQ